MLATLCQRMRIVVGHDDSIIDSRGAGAKGQAYFPEVASAIGPPKGAAMCPQKPAKDASPTKRLHWRIVYKKVVLVYGTGMHSDGTGIDNAEHFVRMTRGGEKTHRLRRGDCTRVRLRAAKETW